MRAVIASFVLVHRLDVSLQDRLVAGLEVALVTCVQLVGIWMGLLHVLLNEIQFLGLKVALLTLEVNLKCSYEFYEIIKVNVHFSTNTIPLCCCELSPSVLSYSPSSLW